MTEEPASASTAAAPPVAYHAAVAAPPIPPPPARPLPAFLRPSSPLPPAPPPVALPIPPAPQPAAAPTPPKSNTARFVADQAKGPTIAPAADGSLPKLQLADSVVDPTAQPESRPVPLWLALLLIIVSTGLSALLLLSEDVSPAKEKTKAEARRELEQFYGRGDGPLLPYQVHLREAQLAHSRREFSVERSRYRQVLAMLRAEGRGPYVGLAGTPRDDEELARLLTILLATD